MGTGHDGDRIDAFARHAVRMRKGERDSKRTTDGDRPRGAHTYTHAHAKIKRRKPIIGSADGVVGEFEKHRTLATTVPAAPGDEATSEFFASHEAAPASELL